MAESDSVAAASSMHCGARPRPRPALGSASPEGAHEALNLVAQAPCVDGGAPHEHAVIQGVILGLKHRDNTGDTVFSVEVDSVSVYNMGCRASC